MLDWCACMDAYGGYGMFVGYTLKIDVFYNSIFIADCHFNSRARQPSRIGFLLSACSVPASNLAMASLEQLLRSVARRSL